MLAFTCDRCGQLVFFENTACLACGTELGVIAHLGLVAIDPDGDGTLRLVGDEAGAAFRRCANHAAAGCNWLVPVESGDGFCRSCALTRTVPAAGDPAAGEPLAVAEAAKRRLVFQLDGLGLPIVGRDRDPDHGLAFDLLSSNAGPVTTGHQDGLITIDLAESDDVHREQVRRAMGEQYRTMLGHLRHEIGHYFWMRFALDPTRLDRIRAAFGDDTLDYADALRRHYDDGPAPGWEDCYVSAYATAHPWEDWAETFAHYLHIRGTLQTAAAYGMVVTGPPVAEGSAVADQLTSTPEHDVDHLPFARILEDWLPLTYALNELNRSMGKRPLYPFVLAPAVVDKLSLVHELVTEVAAEGAT